MPRRNATYDIRRADVPRDLFPRGRLKFSLGLPLTPATRGEVQRRRAEMEALRNLHAWDILNAVRSRRMSIAEVSRRVRTGGEGALPELRRELQKRAVGTPPTFGHEIERYLRWSSEHREQGSFLAHRSRLGVAGRVVRPDGISLHSVPISEVSPADVKRVLAEIGGAPNTRESYRVAISGLFRWSILEEQDRAREEKREPRWTVNPAANVEAIRKTSRITTATREQILALLAAAEPHQEAYVRAFVHLGLRLGELQHTRLTVDLNLERWTWHIRSRGPDPRCRCIPCSRKGWKPKTLRSQRSIGVPQEPAGLRGAILQYLSCYPAAVGDFAFRNPRTGGPWNARALQQDFRTLCERADVRYGRDDEGGVTLHTLRHTCATNLVRAGVRESVVAALLGDTVKTVIDTYVHLNEADLAAGIRQGPAY